MPKRARASAASDSDDAPEETSFAAARKSASASARRRLKVTAPAPLFIPPVPDAVRAALAVPVPQPPSEVPAAAPPRDKAEERRDRRRAARRREAAAARADAGDRSARAAEIALRSGVLPSGSVRVEIVRSHAGVSADDAAPTPQTQTASSAFAFLASRLTGAHKRQARSAVHVISGAPRRARAFCV